MSVLSNNSPVTFSAPLPEAVDVVIIGGGIIGMSAAWYLSSDGLSVLVCDKGRIGGEQSTRNWGWIRTQGRDAAEVPIAKESIKLWESLARSIDEDIGFERQSIMYLAESEKEMVEFEAWLSIARENDLPTRLIDAQELGNHLDHQNHAWLGAMHTPHEARAEPFKAVPAIARAARKRGVQIIENCAVRAVEREAGITTEVVTELGRVRSKAVLLAGGAWTSAFLANLGISMPQLMVKGTVARTSAVSAGFAGAAGSHKFTFRKRQDGGYTVTLGDYLDHYIGADSFRYFAKFLPALAMSWSGMRVRFDDGLMSRLFPTRRWASDEVSPFEKVRVLNPEPNRKVVARIEKLARDTLPQLANASVVESWAGMIDAPPDFVPVMDAVPNYQNLYVASGFSGHGFGIGPGAGKVMADMIQGNPIAFDLNRFRFSRFSDGSKIVPGPAL